MTKSEKKKYNARYYREHKDYWKNLARNHGQYANREELRLASAQSRHARIRNEPHLTLSPELKAKARRYANQAISSAAALNEASKARANAKDRYNYWKHNNTSSAAKNL